MKLFEKYATKPHNYLLFSEGGYGKTTSLKYLSEKSKGKQIAGKTVIPIYFKMAELNVSTILLNGNFIVNRIKEKFNNSVTDKAVFEMIKESESYDFLIILDGYNEVNNYVLNDGQEVYAKIENSLLDLFSYENVHFIISLRKKEDLFHSKDLNNSFIYLELKELKNEQIKKYLEIKKLDDNVEHLKEIIRNPFFLKMFKVILCKDKKKSLELKSKYDLMKSYYETFEVHENEERIDNLAEVRRYVIEIVLPLVGFQVEIALMDNSKNRMELLNFDDMITNIVEDNPLPSNITLTLVKNVLNMMSILDKNLMFNHQIVGEYFGFLGLKKQVEYANRKAQVKTFFELLDKKMFYDENLGLDFLRRTQFLDLAEFIEGGFPSNSDLRGFLESLYFDKRESITLTEVFLQNLAGLYDDLHHGELACKIGWKAIDLLAYLNESKYVLADKYNFLYYSVNKFKGDDPLWLLEKAKELINEIPNEEKDLKYKKLKAKILSNFGSYYCSVFKTDYKIAMKYHEEALNYRKRNKLPCIQSYRTLMSDCYHLKEYEKAYDFYKQAILDEENTMLLSEIDNKKNIPVDLIVYVMGSEIPILRKKGDLNIEISKELTVQIKCAYEKITESARVNIVMLRILKDNIETLLNIEDIEKDLRIVAEKYLNKCAAFF